MSNNKEETIELKKYPLDSIFIVNIKNNDGTNYLPCLPFDDLSNTDKIKNGKQLLYMESVELGPGNFYYKFDYLDKGDIILISQMLDEHLDYIPTINRRLY